MAEASATTIQAHLKELRKRLIVSAIAALLGFVISFAISESLYDLLTIPLRRALPEGEASLVFIGVTEPILVYLKVGFAGGVILASPVILYEAWAFIAPGLYKEEKRWFFIAVFSSLLLFVLGVAFAYFVVFPFAFKYLLGYASEGLRPVLSMGSYFYLSTRLLLAFGIIFQLPLAMLTLSVWGVVSARKLTSWWRYAIVAIFLVSAVLTPTPDILNQLLMAGPLVILYGIGLLLATLFGKKEKGEDEEGE